MTKKLGCDHLDAPYRRLLKENEELSARVKELEQSSFCEKVEFEDGK